MTSNKIKQLVLKGTSSIAALSIAFLLAACASSKPEIEALAKVEHPKTFTIDEPISRLLAKGTLEQGLLPGQYQSTYENMLGTYFQGINQSLYEKSLPKGRTCLHLGGVWIPKSPDVKPRLYFLNGSMSCYDTWESAQQAINQTRATSSSKQQAGTSTYNPTALSIAQNASANPSTGAPGPIAPTAVGGAMGMLIVNKIIESERGTPALLGVVSDDRLQPTLESIAAKLKN